MRLDGLVADDEALGDLRLHELTPHRATLEDAYMALTRDALQYASADDGEASR